MSADHQSSARGWSQLQGLFHGIEQGPYVVQHVAAFTHAVDLPDAEEIQPAAPLRQAELVGSQLLRCDLVAQICELVQHQLEV